MSYRRTTEEYFKAVKEKLPNAKFLSNYENQTIPLLIENKYGICSISAIIYFSIFGFSLLTIIFVGWVFVQCTFY